MSANALTTWPPALTNTAELADTTSARAKTCSHEFLGSFGSLTFHQTAYNACLRALECRIAHAGQCQVRCLRWTEAYINIYTCARCFYSLHLRNTNDQFMHSLEIQPMAVVLLAPYTMVWVTLFCSGVAMETLWCYGLLLGCCYSVIMMLWVVVRVLLCSH